MRSGTLFAKCTRRRGDFISDIIMRGILIEAEVTPAYTRANLNQSASYLSTRTVQTASEMKPHLRKITADVNARETFKSNRAREILLSVAEKVEITPGDFAKLTTPDRKTPEPALPKRNTQGVLSKAQNIFGLKEAIGKKTTELPNPASTPQEINTARSSSALFATRRSGFSFQSPAAMSAPRTPGKGTSKGKGKWKWENADIRYRKNGKARGKRQSRQRMVR